MARNDVTYKFNADTTGVKRKLNGLKKQIGATGKGFASALSVPVGAAAVGATLVGLAVKSANLAAQYEQTKVAFETMLGSADLANKVLSDLTEFSTVTPFEPDQVYNAGRALLAFGVTANELVPTLRKIGDLSAGTGKDFNELAAIFGKIKTKGKAQAQELNQLAEAGIPIVQELADMYDTAAENIFKMASNGEIAFADIETAFGRMTDEGGRFHEMMKKQSETLSGVMSTLMGNVNEIGRAIGESWLKELKMAANYTNDVAKAMNEVARAQKAVRKDKTFEGETPSLWKEYAKQFSTSHIARKMLGIGGQEFELAPATEEEIKDFQDARNKRKKDAKKAELAKKEEEQKEVDAKKAELAKKEEEQKIAAANKILLDESSSDSASNGLGKSKPEKAKDEFILLRAQMAATPGGNALERIGASFGGAPTKINKFQSDNIAILKKIEKNTKDNAGEFLE